MRAVRFDRFGDVDVLEVRDLEEPRPGADEVVVEVLATSINPGEIMIRTGGAPSDAYSFPMGQGSDLAGRVVAVGGGVSTWQVGDEVAGWTDARAAQAQQVAVPAHQLTRRPAEVSWDQAGSLYVAGGTAYAMRDAVSPQRGETAVVTAAAGGVGAILSQVLVHDGVRVLGVAGPDNDDYLRSIGVEPVNRGEDLAGRLAGDPHGVDVFLDCFGAGYTDLGLQLTDRVVTIADFEAAQHNAATVVFGYQSTSADTLAVLLGLMASGEVGVEIAASYPLEQVREAYTELAERRTRGKIVLHPHD
ncbi:NADP-dependent oxidoreductase [Nocardioides mangrovicus]|uniref:NADP-dependent oxidoreductase n=1 Tax=Nocardioides mangrovicus TaxID=2478913 RepID=A0A3L8P010_9ACTN|nr:NADP-dependent oxidoreductase [Nocardioides mangrovicus]RLV48766.1 NADP-dependent oxidoreductase [Nocardioides mangrovicus]